LKAHRGAFAPGSGFDKLEAIGIVSSSAEPDRPARGRPRGRIIGARLRFWVSVIKAYGDARGSVITTRKAVQIAQEIMRINRPTFIGREQDYYAEVRKVLQGRKL
jgi:hypothetical protein